MGGNNSVKNIHLEIDSDSFKKSNSWQAYLQLELTKNDGGTRLTRNRHQGPLYVQKPFYPEGEDCAHVYLLHPPGGLVSGDRLELAIKVAEGANTLVTTPGAARLYKARPDLSLQQQQTHLQLQQNSVLEWFPMEVIVYPGASAQMQTSIDLGADSRFMGWEINCFGLPASNESFSTGSFYQTYRIEQSGLPVFIDKIQFNAENQRFYTGAAGLQSQPVSGFFIAGPFLGSTVTLIAALRQEIEFIGLKANLAVSQIKDFLIIRYLGMSAFGCRQGFVNLWKLLRPALIGRQACEPRIWLT